MKNHFIFLLGLILLVITVWITTMAGINANKRFDKNNSVCIEIFICKDIFFKTTFAFDDLEQN